MFLRPKKLFLWGPDKEEFTAPLKVRNSPELNLDSFPLGIDNAHIDVLLSPEFISRTRIYIRRHLLYQVEANCWGESPSPPDLRELQNLLESYVGIAEVVADRVRGESQPELIQLFHFAVFKFLFTVVGEEFSTLKEEIQELRGSSSHQSSSKSLKLHERLVALAKEEPNIRYLTTRRLFKEIHKVERIRLSKLRKSVLGRAWPVPRQMLFNPLLQLPSLWADEQLMNHYTLVCTDRDNTDSFGRVNRLVHRVFRNYLPDWFSPLFSNAKKRNLTDVVRERQDQGVLSGFQEVERLLSRTLQENEFSQGLTSWFDTPSNIDLFIYSAKPKRSLRVEQKPVTIWSTWSHKKWSEFHHRTLKRFFRRIEGGQLERSILACNAAPKLYKALAGQVPVRLICQYISGTIKHREMGRKIAPTCTAPDYNQSIRILARAKKGLGYLPVPKRRRRMLGFLREFSQLRSDLKLAYLAHWNMNRIRLLTRPEDVTLSRSNGLLHEFVLRNELKPEQAQIRSHVIIKADVRGSTTITHELNQRSLNPASHFSLNFFEPINALLSKYGAQKVFIEGDAVILSLYEYEDKSYQWLCVSHACGLARQILKVVEAQNVKNRAMGLPSLELGLGIAYSDEAPAFLYDGDSEIMISSAINLADRLSSCSLQLRESDYGRRLGQTVEVMTPADAANSGNPDELLRYNVNGINMGPAAFAKLKSELNLHATKSKKKKGVRFFASRYPDLEGKMQWLVVREAPVQVWDRGTVGGVDPRGRCFYQVITDPVRIKRVADKSRRERPATGNAQFSSSQLIKDA